jgi:hypothetical protein
MEKHLSLATLIALLGADIEIFLLKEEDQETDIDKLYTPEEIREQLFASEAKVLDVLTKLGFDVHKLLKQ